jgi:hypothetical protein
VVAYGDSSRGEKNEIPYIDRVPNDPVDSLCNEGLKAIMTPVVLIAGCTLLLSGLFCLLFVATTSSMQTSPIVIESTMIIVLMQLSSEVYFSTWFIRTSTHLLLPSSIYISTIPAVSSLMLNLLKTGIAKT